MIFDSCFYVSSLYQKPSCEEVLKHSRHNEVCNIIFRAAQNAGLGPSREFRGLIPGFATRSADIFLQSWNRGCDAALDVTVISPLQSAVVDLEARGGAQMENCTLCFFNSILYFYHLYCFF